MSGAFSQDFQGDIYPVHPKAKNILGYKVYPRLRDIPGEIDLAIFTIPATAALSSYATQEGLGTIRSRRQFSGRDARLNLRRKQLA